MTLVYAAGRLFPKVDKFAQTVKTKNWRKNMNKFISNAGFGLGCLTFLVISAVVIGLSWLATCGMVYLITLCFGWTFSWLAGTGVWVALMLLAGFLAPSKNSKG